MSDVVTEKIYNKFFLQERDMINNYTVAIQKELKNTYKKFEKQILQKNIKQIMEN